MKIGKLKDRAKIPPTPLDVWFHCANTECPTARKVGSFNITKITVYDKTREEIMEMFVPKCPVCNKFMKL